MSKLSFRDILLVLSIASIGYGFYLIKPWMAFVACGFLVLIAVYL